jgi:hypothetical protein
MLKARFVCFKRMAILKKRILDVKQVSPVHENGPQFEGANLTPFERNCDVENFMTPLEDSLIDHVSAN